MRDQLIKKGVPKIMVVDDDRSMRLTLRHVLEQEGYEVIEAGDGLEALSVYGVERPDIVLMDCMMPVLDGFTACAQLHELPGGCAPVIILTGLNDYKSVEIAFEAGATDFITKPVNWAVLLQRVHGLLRPRQQEASRRGEKAGPVTSDELDGIITVDNRGLIRSFNPSAERIFGYSYNEVSGRDVRMLMPGAYRNEDGRAADGQEIQEEKAISISREISGLRKNGSSFPVDLTINGFFTGYRLLIVKDITDRKMTEERVRTSARVFESIPEGIMVTDTRGVIQAVNNAFTVITGYGMKEAVGKNASLLKSGRQGPEFYKKMWDSLLETGQWRGEIWNRRKNGEVYQQQLSISSIKDEQGQVVLFTALFSDLTERNRQMQEKCLLREKNLQAYMFSRTGAVTDLVKQHVNSIRAIVDGLIFLGKTGSFPEQEKVVENLLKISDLAARTDEFIMHVGSFVDGVESGATNSCSLNDVVAGALDTLDFRISSGGIAVKTALAEDIPLVPCNRNRLAGAVIGLLLNSIQALEHAAGSYKEIICRSGVEGGSVYLEISDNATGISDEIADKIFDPFFSAGKEDNAIGLGLTVVKGIISGCGGEVVFHNNEAGGATFRISIPVRTDRSVGAPLLHKQSQGR
ncbi:MAG: PAS domain S-box protein [Bacillota bacterium]